MEDKVFIMKDSTGNVNIGTTKNLCVVCGTEIPEGREICVNCESKYLSYKLILLSSKSTIPTL